MHDEGREINEGCYPRERMTRHPFLHIYWKEDRRNEQNRCDHDYVCRLRGVKENPMEKETLQIKYPMYSP